MYLCLKRKQKKKRSDSLKILIKFAIGITLFFTRIIQSINHENVETMVYNMRRGGELKNGIYTLEGYYAEPLVLQIYTYSIIPYILGALFIIWGIIELREVKRND